MAYDAGNGKPLWDFFAQTGILAAPVTYEIAGEQYVTVLAGWGGALPLFAGEVVTQAPRDGVNRVLTFRLGEEPGSWSGETDGLPAGAIDSSAAGPAPCRKALIGENTRFGVAGWLAPRTTLNVFSDAACAGAAVANAPRASAPARAARPSRDLAFRGPTRPARGVL